MTRNEIREVLMQMMYEMDAAKTLDLETARKLAGEKLPGKNLKRSLQILSGIIEHLDEIDGSINAHSRSWKTSRMPKVDLAIMRLALGEIKYGDDVPEASVRRSNWRKNTAPSNRHGLSMACWEPS